MMEKVHHQTEMNIIHILSDKKRYLDLLLLADEQESMIDRYLERGALFVLRDKEIKAVCVVTDEGEGVCELKNIAIAPQEQRKGYGRALIGHLLVRYAGKYRLMKVGTGDTPRMRNFYQKCGFTYSHRVENFFTDHYDHPMTEDGILLKDMVYFAQNLSSFL